MLRSPYPTSILINFPMEGEERTERKRWKALLSAAGLVVMCHGDHTELAEELKEIDRVLREHSGDAPAPVTTELFPNRRYGRRYFTKAKPVVINTNPAELIGLAAAMRAAREMKLKPAEAVAAFYLEDDYRRHLSELIEPPKAITSRNFDKSEASSMVDYPETDWLPRQGAVEAVCRLSVPTVHGST